MHRITTIAAFLITSAIPAVVVAQATPVPVATQNPSPMVEETRVHERLVSRELPGVHRTFTGPQGRPVEVWFADTTGRTADLHLVIHFLGAAWLPKQAVSQLGTNAVAAVVNIGAGSGIYDRSFSDPAAFDSLLLAISRSISPAATSVLSFRRVTLSGFSAGHGAIRAILREPRHLARVDAILLLDGMHTSYVPERTVLALGGTLDTRNLDAFAQFAQAAMRGEKRFVVTHSEIFPGTFASTTETADYMIRSLGLRRAAVLRWGPRGMQQTSEVIAGGFAVLGFAGNSGPDHTDHLHGMPEFLLRLGR